MADRQTDRQEDSYIHQMMMNGATKERSNTTVRLGSAVLRCIVLIIWLQFVFLAPLKEDAIRMVSSNNSVCVSALTENG